MKLKAHILSAVIALATISLFWLSTVFSELFGSHALIASVKTGVLYGMIILIPAMATAGATGNALGKGWKLPEVIRKQKRMKLIAANGILILVPSAVFLALRAQAGQFDMPFYAVQTVELIVGALNITLLGLNMRDGIAIGQRKRAAKRKQMERHATATTA